MTEDFAPFRWQPEKVIPGTSYRYTKSNLDGSAAMQVWVNLTGAEAVEVLKLEPHLHSGAYVMAHLNRETFSANSLEAWVVSPDSRRHSASLAISRRDNLIGIALRGKAYEMPVTHYPAHVYNFDLISLAVMFRHLVEPEQTFTFEVFQPTFDPENPTLIESWGMATVRYQATIDYHGKPCRLYALSGGRLDDGLIWVNTATEMVENIEIPVADNPNWHSFKLELQETRMLDSEGWSTLVEQSIAAL